LRTVTSPYDDAEELVAMPALRLDAALVHVNRADRNGSGQILGPDPFFDEVFLGAADRRFVTTEQIVDTEQFASEGPVQTMCVSRMLTDGVVETPGGAHFTACVPDYSRDEEFQRAYVAAASDPGEWSAFTARYLEVSEADYQSAARGSGAAPGDPRGEPGSATAKGGGR
jgi:glutaconate CoA-transferase subunit A